MSGTAGMTIAKFAAAGGVGVETVRYYQRRGLLVTPARAGGRGIGGGVRRYAESDVRRLRFIRAAQGAGFTLEQISELLELDACNDRARVRDLAATRVASLGAKIEELTRARNALRKLILACNVEDGGPSTILTAFDR